GPRFCPAQEKPAPLVFEKEAPACGEAAAASEPPSLWSKVPPVTPTPRAGAFFMPPTGPGYYSLRDVLLDHFREERPKTPWTPASLHHGSFFDNDFRYLDKPDNTQHDCFDPIKRIHLGCDWLLSFGGEERVRVVNEVDSRLSGRDNSFQLLRSRFYG